MGPESIFAMRFLALKKNTARGELRSTWLTIGGVLMHARVSTAAKTPGSPIVLVHGLGVSSRYMIPTALLLAPDYRVYAPDLPGSGRSGRPAHILNIDELADALAAWMRANGLRDAILIGNSLGCQTIAALALRHPALIARAVFIGPTMDPQARTTLQEFGRLLVDSWRESFTQPFLTLFDYWLTGPYRTWRTLQYGLHDRLEAKLPQITIPVLIVRGGRDPIVPQSWVAEIERLLPCGRLIVIPSGAHTLNYSSPQHLLRVLRPFLRAATVSR
jgi:2-hydroxy-6-oxonona-2,4-dienedioate hydrolase